MQFGGLNRPRSIRTARRVRNLWNTRQGQSSNPCRVVCHGGVGGAREGCPMYAALAAKNGRAFRERRALRRMAAVRQDTPFIHNRADLLPDTIQNHVGRFRRGRWAINQMLRTQAGRVEPLAARRFQRGPCGCEQVDLVEVVLGRTGDLPGGLGNVLHSILHRLIGRKI
ncbi:hypothetical protein PGA1_c18610 [Phaeobacter inhibens DSM 17395]|nr:hypothetical protein PGA1_c18610 [Phaeobacter inhibens DSM 17395]